MSQQQQQESVREMNQSLPKIPKFDLNQNDVTDSHFSLLRIKKLSDKAVVPSRASFLSAGYDLSSAAEITVPATGKALAPTDLSIGIPEGTYPRIDADYRGPLGVVLFNQSDVDFEIKCGDRIAQLILQKIVTPEVLQVEDLGSTLSGTGGFGSTGV